ncbi:hypothetical protein KUCAC02_023102 [Chaenocephalus aceratus]|uniref:Uncharacterized protein n=1 Tax=Chaenocephalus aceratus TaxID=36190 RepID=A0ACB9XP03_CHAAC|nr:hypothetical protein KUCAC02_023102 [Chaenocephalus aceratus]
MPVSNKERGARFCARIRADPAAREERLAKRRDRYKQRTQAGQHDHPSVTELTASAAEKKREQWRLNQRQRRERKRQMEAVMNLTPLSEDSFEEPPQVARPEPSQPSSPPGPSQPSSLPRPSVSAQPSSPWEGPLSSSTPDKASCGSQKKNSSHRSENRTRKLREEIEELRKQLLREKRRADAFRKKVQRLNRVKHKTVNEKNRPKVFRKGPERRRV